MQFDDFEVNDDELNERLSSWRRMPGVVSQSALQSGVTSANIEEVRTRQRRIATMCLNTVQAHDAFVRQLKDFLGNGQHRDPMYQQREEDEAAFALGVFEQTTALSLELGIKRELEGLPKEVIQTITVPAPPPPRSWFQRMLGI